MIVLLLPIMISDFGCHRVRKLDAHLVDGVDRRYLEHGRYRERKEIRELVDQLPGLRQKALQRIADRTGLRLPHPDRLAVVLLDDQPFSHATRTEIGGVVHQTVILDAEAIVNGQMNTSQVLTHELTHAVMRQVAGNWHRSIPSWFMEGSAVWVADQIRLKGKRDLLMSVISCQGTERLYDGIDNSRHTFDDYMEDALAFEWLGRKNGVEAVHRVVASVMNGEEPAKAFARESGLPWSAVRRKMRAHSAAYLKALMEEGGYPALRSTRERFRMCLDRVSDACAPVLRDLEVFLKERPDSFLVPAAWYRIGRIHWQAGRLDEAIHAIEISLRLQPFLRNGLYYSLGKVSMEAGRWKRARECFEALLQNQRKIPPEKRREVLLLLCRVYQILDPHGQVREACRAAQ